MDGAPRALIDRRPAGSAARPSIKFAGPSAVSRAPNQLIDEARVEQPSQWLFRQTMSYEACSALRTSS